MSLFFTDTISEVKDSSWMPSAWSDEMDIITTLVMDGG
jgi:hypothetical protein